MSAETDLQHEIDSLPLVDTHEHLHKEERWVGDGPDILQDLFGNYATSELLVAGAPPIAVERLLDSSAGDLSSRFLPVRDAWEAIQLTGYGEAVRLIAREIYGLEELTVDGLEGAQVTLTSLRRPGERLRLLRDVARLDHVQVDDFEPACLPDASGPDFFLYDISWEKLASGDMTGLDVSNLDELRAVIGGVFERYAACAIAVKTQHAYFRTLAWTETTKRRAHWRRSWPAATLMRAPVWRSATGASRAGRSSQPSTTCPSRSTPAISQAPVRCRSIVCGRAISAGCSRATRRRGSC